MGLRLRSACLSSSIAGLLPLRAFEVRTTVFASDLLVEFRLRPLRMTFNNCEVLLLFVAFRRGR